MYHCLQVKISYKDHNKYMPYNCTVAQVHVNKHTCTAAIFGAKKVPDRYSSFADENKILKNSLRGPP